MDKIPLTPSTSRCFAFALVAVLGLSLISTANTNISPLQQQSSSNQTDSPVSIVLVVDMSNSLFGTRKAERQALFDSFLQFVQSGNKDNEYSLIAIGTEPALLLERSSDTKVIQDQLIKLFSQERKGATALYDACSLAVEKIIKGKHTRHVIIVVSDGIDTSSYKSLNELQKLLAKSKVPICTIGISKPGGDIIEQQGGNRTLKAIASASGGKSFNPKGTQQIISAFDSIKAELKR
jgi:VWFA-related protein